MDFRPLIEKGLLPDPLIRFGIRRLLAARLREEAAADPARQEERLQAFLRRLHESPVAMSVEDANAQHYEVPAAFFEQVMGRRMKYSCGLWPAETASLDASEEVMLDLTARRALLEDGQEVLELGCGWGSLTLFMAERFPKSRITAVSNSASQKAFIEARARRRGLSNVAVATADINAFAPAGTFDRVVSVEMFEHVRNYGRLLERIASWMRPGGRLFVHIFCHRTAAYPFEVRDASDWMARYFFTGGTMPSADLLLHFQDHLLIEERWLVDGTHYQRTSEAWLSNLDRHRAAALEVLQGVYGPGEGLRRLRFWRVFFMACAELFGFRGGREWMVAHYRFRGR
jgi:cyclopropane-fatty-acyl-phospholipid synthase